MIPELPLPIAACRFCGSDCHVEARPNGVHTSYQVICEDVPSDCGYKGPTRIYKQVAVLLHNEAMAASPAADEGAVAAADEIALAFKLTVYQRNHVEMLLRKHSAVSSKAAQEEEK